MHTSEITPPLSDLSKDMHFANVTEFSTFGHFSTNAFNDKWNEGVKRIGFKPASSETFESVDEIFAMDDFVTYQTREWKVGKSLKDDVLWLKVPKDMDLDNVKGKSATVHLAPSLYFNTKDKKAGPFYKIINIE